MRRVLFVSKPICPPFTDGTRNLVRDLAQALGPERAEVMTPRGTPLAGATSREIYGPKGPKHTLGRSDALRLVAHLATARLPSILHWFFTPASSTRGLPGSVARLRSARTVWTLPSAPTAPLRPRDVAHVDQLIVLSEATRSRLLGWGVGERVTVVRPWLSPIAPPSAAQLDALRERLGLRGRTITFSGDLGPGRGDMLTLEAFARARREGDVLVIAARPKGVHAASARRALLERIDALAIGAAVRMVDTVPDMPALLAASDLIALPATVLDAKVDVPLVLLEALSLGKAVVVAENAPPADLARRGGARAVVAAVEPLALAMRELLDAPDARAALGAAGRALVAQDHAASVLARTHEALYDALSP